MSDKDRSSPTLVENSLKSLLDQPSIFPLIGDPMITSSLKGKQGKDGPEEKKDADGELWGNVEAQAAFLGPNLWDKTLPYDADLKVLNHYVDLDEFLSENGIPVDGVAGGGQGAMQGSQLHKINNTEAAGHQGPAGLHPHPRTPVSKKQFSFLRFLSLYFIPRRSRRTRCRDLPFSPTNSGYHDEQCALSSVLRFTSNETDAETRTMWKTTTVILVITIGIALLFRSNPTHTDVPKLPETFWGPEKNKGASKEIRSFVINISKSVIDDLKERLTKRREFVEPLENAAWTYGISSTYLKDVLEYWRTKYNWTERQALLNKYPQYMTNIQGLDIHFYHVKPTIPPNRKNVKVLPLLLIHGWPGSVVEFQKIIPLLTTVRPDKDFVFEVIAPSLPGYGFSQAAVRPGMGPAQMSVVFKNLMLRLGFNKFYMQGGDWGSAIVAHLGALFPDNILGGHSNMCMSLSKCSMFWRILGSYVPSLVVDTEYQSRMYPLGYHMGRMLEEMGYLHIQATKPDTIGTAVAASPVGLAAYLLEKFSTWTNPEYRFRPDGGLLEKYTLDELLDNIMLYWVTNSLTTSTRIYAEHFTKAALSSGLEELPVNVPIACAAFPHELAYQPESLLHDKYTNLIQFNHLPRGGHFAAFEEPVLLADDVFEFVSKAEDIRKKSKEMPNTGKKIKEPTKI